jgi:hypothetical protein
LASPTVACRLVCRSWGVASLRRPSCALRPALKLLAPGLIIGLHSKATRRSTGWHRMIVTQQRLHLYQGLEAGRCKSRAMITAKRELTRATAGTNPSCLALIRPGNEASPLALRAQPGRKEQRCCAASAPHSGKTKGAGSPPPHSAAPALTRTTVLASRLSDFCEALGWR